MITNIKKLEAELWESADLLRQGSKLTSSQYCMPVLALLFLRYAFSRFKMVEAEILQSRPSRGGRVMPVEASDFVAKSALFLPREAQYDYLVNLKGNIADLKLKTKDGQDINSLGEAVNYAMQLVEEQSEQLTGVLPKSYTMFADDLLADLLRIFNNQIKGSAMDALIASLPTVTNRNMRVIGYEGEQNIITVEQVKAVKAKGWNPLYYTNGSWLECTGAISICLRHG